MMNDFKRVSSITIGYHHHPNMPLDKSTSQAVLPVVKGMHSMFNLFSPFVEAAGLAGALLTTIAFLPQVVRTWRQGGEGLSSLMLALFIAGAILWLLYGLAIGSLPIVLANGVTALQAVIMLVLKLRGARSREEVK
jgi:MtN3 and saliva related transmembrane protein